MKTVDNLMRGDLVLTERFKVKFDHFEDDGVLVCYDELNNMILIRVAEVIKVYGAD